MGDTISPAIEVEEVPLGIVGVTLVSMPATSLLLLVMCYATWRTIVISVGLQILGVMTYPFLQHAKAKGWIEFVEQKEPAAELHRGGSGESSASDSDDSEPKATTGCDSILVLLGSGDHREYPRAIPGWRLLRSSALYASGHPMQVDTVLRN